MLQREGANRAPAAPWAGVGVGAGPEEGVPLCDDPVPGKELEATRLWPPPPQPASKRRIMKRPNSKTILGELWFKCISAGYGGIYSG